MVLMREDELPGKLLSPYGVTKAAAESMAGVYHHLYNLPTTVSSKQHEIEIKELVVDIKASE